MARRGMATAAIVGIVVVVLVGAGVFGYMFLIPSSHNSSTTSQTATYLPTSISTVATSTTQDNVVISNAALSNGSLLVTIQNTGSQPVSISSLLVTPGSGGCSFFGPATTSTTTSATSASNQTRPGFALPACMAQSAVFSVQSNSSLRAIPVGQFNFTGAFNSTVFSRTFSGNFSRTFSANFSRTISGNFSRGFPGGNFSGRFPGNFTAGGGLQLAAGQSVTLTYAGPIGSGVSAGSQYTIVVTGVQAEAQITLKAS
jgi:hypothetical protein